MAHPLIDEVRAVGRQARRLVVARGVCAFLAVGIVAAFAVGATDCVFRFHDLGLRVIASTIVAASLVWAFVKFVVPALRFPCGDVPIAQQVERCFPELADHLSTAVAFAGQADSDPLNGSAALRRAAVAETMRIASGLKLDECLDSRATKRSAAGLLIVAVFVAGVCLRDVATAALAVRRLVFPLGAESWPRLHHLAFSKRPERLAVGEDLEVELIDERGRLPDDVKLVFQFESEPSAPIQSRSMQPRGERMVGRVEHLSRSLRFRAIGGDDDTMPWYVVDVVTPPQITDLHIRLFPPPYTQMPVEETGRQIQAWEGSRVEIRGSVDKPVESLSVVVEAAGKRRSFAAALNETSRGFSVPADANDACVLTASGSYEFEFRSRDGYSAKSVSRGEIRVHRDEPPTLALTSPAAHSLYTNGARVPIRAVARDDLAIRSVELHYDGQSTVLYRSGDGAAIGKESVGKPSLGFAAAESVEYLWDLALVPGLKPGDLIEFHLTASDNKPQHTKSDVVRLTLVSAGELQVRADQRQAAIAGRLREALRLQRLVRSHVTSLETSLRQTGSLSMSETDLLQNAELNQRQVQRAVTGEVDGALRLVENLLEELESNRLDPTSLIARLRLLRDALGGIDRGDLVTIQRELVAALKTLRPAPAAEAEAPAGTPSPRSAADATAGAQSLAVAGAAQDRVVQSLEALGNKLSQWESLRQLAHDTERLRSQQQELALATAALSTTARDVQQLTPKARSELLQLAAKQLDVAREFDRLLNRIEKGRSEAAVADPLAAATLAEAAQAARQLAIGGGMREIARHVDENRVGQALRQQREVLGGLDQLFEILARRRDRELDHALRSLREAARLKAALMDLIARQETLCAETQKTDQRRRAAADPSSAVDAKQLAALAERQEQVASATERLREDKALSETMRFALLRTGRPMQSASALLARHVTGADVQQLQRVALERLRTLHALLEPKLSAPPEQTAADRPRDPPETKPGVALSELKLLHALQLDINRRTAELGDRSKSADVPRVDAQREIAQLAADQARLADLITTMIPPPVPKDLPTEPKPPHDDGLDKALQDAGVPGFSEPRP